MVASATLALATMRKPIQIGTKMVVENELGTLAIEIVEPAPAHTGELCRDCSSPLLSGSGIGFTRREKDLLECLMHGDSNKVIAKKLAITEATVKVLMRGLLRKISCHNRTQAAIWGLKRMLSRHETPTVEAPKVKVIAA